jgi:hypothetical protein
MVPLMYKISARSCRSLYHLSLGFRVYFISVVCCLVDGLELVFLHHPPSLVSFSEFYSRNMCTLLHLNVFPGYDDFLILKLLFTMFHAKFQYNKLNGKCPTVIKCCSMMWVIFFIKCHSSLCYADLPHTFLSSI